MEGKWISLVEENKIRLELTKIRYDEDEGKDIYKTNYKGYEKYEIVDVECRNIEDEGINKKMYLFIVKEKSLTEEEKERVRRFVINLFITNCEGKENGIYMFKDFHLTIIESLVGIRSLNVGEYETNCSFVICYTKEYVKEVIREEFEKTNGKFEIEECGRRRMIVKFTKENEK